MTMMKMNKIKQFFKYLTYFCFGLLIITGILSMFSITNVVTVMLVGGCALLSNTCAYFLDELGIFLVNDKKK